MDLLCLFYSESGHAPDNELAKFMVLKDNCASVYVALNYEGGQEKIMELSSMLRNLEISEYEFTNRLYKP